MRMRWIIITGAAAMLGAACSGDGAVDTTTTTQAAATTQASTTTSTTTTTTPSTTTSTTTTTTSTLAAAVTLPRSDPFVTTVGIGSIKIGMTVEAAEEAAGFSLDGEADPDVSPTCYIVSPPPDEAGYEGVSFMVEDGEIVRVDVGGASAATTRSGAGLGITEADLRAMYPGQLEPIEVLAGGGSGLQFVPADQRDANYRVVFVFEAGVVTAFRSGILPAVAYTEGCV
jgi:hypothetical protein